MRLISDNIANLPNDADSPEKRSEGLEKNMNWYYFEYRYPFTFYNFLNWFDENYPEEMQQYTAPVFSTDRLVEFFKANGYNITIFQNDMLGKGWHARVGSECRYRFNTYDEALQAGLYRAFDKVEKNLN